MMNDERPLSGGGSARAGVVYFAQCRDAVKIGFTTGAPEARIASLQTGCPWPIWLLGSIPSPSAGEVLLHNALADHRLRGEWFNAEAIAGVVGGLGVQRPLLVYQVAWLEPSGLAIEPLTEHSHVRERPDHLVLLETMVLARSEFGAMHVAAKHFQGLSAGRVPRRHSDGTSAGDLVFVDTFPDQWGRVADLLEGDLP